MNYTTFENLADHCFSIDGYYTTTFQPFDMPYHCHDNYELIYIVQGNCSVILLNDSQEKNETVTLFTNQFIVINSGQFHRLIVDESNTKIMNLEIKPVVSKSNNFSFLHSLHACPTLKTLLKKNPPYYKMTDIEYVQETIPTYPKRNPLRRRTNRTARGKQLSVTTAHPRTVYQNIALYQSKRHFGYPVPENSGQIYS